MNAHEWVAVAERTPPEGFVLMCIWRRHYRSPDVKLGYWDEGRGHWYYPGGIRLEEWETATHWMPLPDPPAEPRGPAGESASASGQLTTWRGG